MNLSDQILVDKHKLYVEAVRHLESGVLQYVGILGASLAGFTWLVSNKGTATPNEVLLAPALTVLRTNANSDVSENAFLLGAIGVLFLLTVGAIYCVASGSNYRCFVLQVARIELNAQAEDLLLQQWHPSKIIGRNAYCWWDFLPDTIRMFWAAFMLALVGVLLLTCLHGDLRWWWIVAASLAIILNCWCLFWYLWKYEKIRQLEEAFLSTRFVLLPNVKRSETCWKFLLAQIRNHFWKTVVVPAFALAVAVLLCILHAHYCR